MHFHAFRYFYKETHPVCDLRIASFEGNAIQNSGLPLGYGRSCNISMDSKGYRQAGLVSDLQKYNEIHHNLIYFIYNVVVSKNHRVKPF